MSGLFFRRWREVFLTADLGLYGMVLQELKEKGISAETKTVNHGTQNRQTGILLGRAGENTKIEILYYVYVSPEDESAAKLAVEEAKRKYHPE